MVAYSFKQRFVAPIRIGLGKEVFDAAYQSDSVVLRPKRQTIRAIGRRRHARPGETLQLYTAMRTKQCEKIGDSRCTEVIPIFLVVKTSSMPIKLDGAVVDLVRMDDFARADGFENADDMHAFWKKEHGLGYFNGVLIRWEPIEQGEPS